MQTPQIRTQKQVGNFIWQESKAVGVVVDPTLKAQFNASQKFFEIPVQVTTAGGEIVTSIISARRLKDIPESVQFFCDRVAAGGVMINWDADGNRAGESISFAISI